MIGFWIVAIFMVFTSLGVVLSKNLFRSAIYLGITLVLTAVVYLLLNAELLAFMQILLYTGGVMVLLVFAIMLTREIVGKTIEHQSRGVVFAGLVSVFLMVIMFAFLGRTELPLVAGKMPENMNLGLGTGLFLKYVLPFEALSVLLLAAIIGAIVIAKKEKEN